MSRVTQLLLLFAIASGIIAFTEIAGAASSSMKVLFLALVIAFVIKSLYGKQMAESEDSYFS